MIYVWILWIRTSSPFWNAVWFCLFCNFCIPVQEQQKVALKFTVHYWIALVALAAAAAAGWLQYCSLRPFVAAAAAAATPPAAAAAIKFCWSCMLCQQRIIFSPPKVRRVRDLHMSSVGLICLMMVAVAWFDHDITDKSTWQARRGNPLKGKSFAANLQLSLNSAEWSRDTSGCKKLLPCSANTYWWLLVISHI